MGRIPWLTCQRRLRTKGEKCLPCNFFHTAYLLEREWLTDFGVVTTVAGAAIGFKKRGGTHLPFHPPIFLFAALENE